MFIPKKIYFFPENKRFFILTKAMLKKTIDHRFVWFDEKTARFHSKLAAFIFSYFCQKSIQRIPGMSIFCSASNFRHLIYAVGRYRYKDMPIRIRTIGLCRNRRQCRTNFFGRVSVQIIFSAGDHRRFHI